jgi:hypothetical protein
MSVVQEQATPTADHRRTGWGIAVGALTAVVVAVPAFWTALFAMFSFTGCFIECREPEPLTGALWAGISLLLVLTPAFAGMTVARAGVRSRAVTMATLSVAVVATFAVLTLTA